MPAGWLLLYFCIITFFHIRAACLREPFVLHEDESLRERRMCVEANAIRTPNQLAGRNTEAFLPATSSSKPPPLTPKQAPSINHLVVVPRRPWGVCVRGGAPHRNT